MASKNIVRARPVVKWAGGKTRLLPELAARVPRSFKRYYEPFAGGAALFFHLAPRQAVLADTNRDLINLYKTIARSPNGVIAALGRHQAKHSRRYYYATRARWNDPDVRWKAVARAAAFVYLNKTCFNGLWRVNRAGQFNVPVGKYDNPTICAPDVLLAAHAQLAHAELRCTSYQLAITDTTEGDFVYFDPPYDPVTKTSNFTGYTPGAFDADDQRELAANAWKLVGRGCKVMLSNSDTKFIRGLYSEIGFRIDRVKCPRAINSNGKRRGMVNELIVTGGYKVTT